MRLDPAPLCVRNDGGTLCRPAERHGPVLICDVCRGWYSVELLEQTIKSTWEALRLGYQPMELRPAGRVVLVRRWSRGVPYITAVPFPMYPSVV